PGFADQLFSGKPLTHFSAVSETAVSALLKKMACKTCDLDPIPTSLLFDCSDEIVPALTHVVNQSLLSGTFPTVFKHAIVKPLLKKTSLDPNDLKKTSDLFQTCLSFLSCWRRLSCLSYLIILTQMNFGLGFNLLIVLVTPLKPLYLES
ncbi:hypothetical protein, partial [Thiolapillus sp.]